MSPGPNAAATPRPFGIGRCRGELLEHEQDSGRRRVAGTAEHVARCGDLVLAEIQAAHDEVDDRLAAGVSGDRVEVACVADEPVDERREIRLQQTGQLPRDDDAEAVIRSLEPERIGARCDEM